jgi:hypothetical protein
MFLNICIILKVFILIDGMIDYVDGYWLTVIEQYY